MKSPFPKGGLGGFSYKMSLKDFPLSAFLVTIWRRRHGHLRRFSLLSRVTRFSRPVLKVVFESLDDTQPLPLRHQGSRSLIKRKYRMAGKEISGLKFLFGVHIGNQNPLIKPKRQRGIDSVS